MDSNNVMQILQNIISSLFAVQAKDIENISNTQLNALIKNAIDGVYFLLVVSRRFRITLSDEMMENCMYWTLDDFANSILKCDNLRQNHASFTER